MGQQVKFRHGKTPNGGLWLGARLDLSTDKRSVLTFSFSHVKFGVPLGSEGKQAIHRKHDYPATAWGPQPTTEIPRAPSQTTRGSDPVRLGHVVNAW